MAKILVVDDIAMTNRLMQIMLGRINHTAITVNNGREALDYLRDSSVDLMITDIMMPEMDGLTLLSELRASDQYKDLPIIVMTASGQEQLPRQATEKGARMVLTQPISSWELNHAVSQCLSPAAAV
ncbi:MAG: response regulator [Chloroflexi bacterium]|nr:response regulator [Chloroflexota bacterium]